MFKQIIMALNLQSTDGTNGVKTTSWSILQFTSACLGKKKNQQCDFDPTGRPLLCPWLVIWDCGTAVYFHPPCSLVSYIVLSLLCNCLASLIQYDTLRGGVVSSVIKLIKKVLSLLVAEWIIA